MFFSNLFEKISHTLRDLKLSILKILISEAYHEISKIELSYFL